MEGILDFLVKLDVPESFQHIFGSVPMHLAVNSEDDFLVALRLLRDFVQKKGTARRAGNFGEEQHDGHKTGEQMQFFALPAQQEDTTDEPKYTTE